MSHLLKEYRGKVQLIYIDPPFDSRVDYKMKVELKGKKATNDISTFEEKQYGDIWTNDEYLQFMYERIVIMKELLSDRDKKDLQLKREAEAEIVKEGNKLVIRSFYPMNLMQKLSLQKEYVEDWRQLVESIMIDWNYDGVVMQPAVTDVPDKKKIVRGIYDIPEDAGTIRVKITDLLAESLEMEVE